MKNHRCLELGEQGLSLERIREIIISRKIAYIGCTSNLFPTISRHAKRFVGKLYASEVVPDTQLVETGFLTQYIDAKGCLPEGNTHRRGNRRGKGVVFAIVGEMKSQTAGVCNQWIL